MLPIVGTLAIAAAIAGSGSGPVDPGFAWFQEHTAETIENARTAAGAFAAATDPARPTSFDEISIDSLGSVISLAYTAASEEDQGNLVAAATRAVNRTCEFSADGREAASTAWLVAALYQSVHQDKNSSNYISNATRLLCGDAIPTIWARLESAVYNNVTAWKDGLAYNPTPSLGGPALQSALQSGHDLFTTVYHARMLANMIESLDTSNCNPAVALAMRNISAAISAGLAGPLLWDGATGMYVPSSLNNAHNTDVWGSALAVHLGIVPKARADRIVAWFGAHWAEVVQDGQIKHLAAGQYWAETSFWEYDVYQNGGFWGTASGFVLPVIAMNSSVIAEQLVREAISVAQAKGGIAEWQNADFCCNCRGGANWALLTPYPTNAHTAGVSGDVASTAGVYAAARVLLDDASRNIFIQTEPTKEKLLPRQRPQWDQMDKLDPRATSFGPRAIKPPSALFIDNDVAWMQAYGKMYQASARICGGSNRYYQGCFYPPAADPSRPSAYSSLYTRDFEYTVEFLHDVLDGEGWATAYNQTMYIIDGPQAPGGVADEPIFRAKLLSNLATYYPGGDSINGRMFCTHVDKVYAGLAQIYADPNSFKDGLIYSAAAIPGYGFTDSIPKSGHHLYDSVLHVQALTQLAELSERWSCGSPVGMRNISAAITAGLAGPLLWDDATGMYVPSSLNNAHNTDVWGSALAVHLGIVPKARADRIVAWFGAHWAEVVQDGQIKHLAAGQYWAETSFWEYDVYQNGGFWGTASGFVLPVIAMNSSVIAEQLVREAVADARANGLNEWKNSKFSSGCRRSKPSVQSSTASTRAPAVVPGPMSSAYCMHVDWVGGAMTYGPNIGSVYRAAQYILGGNPTPPPRPPAPPVQPPAGCNLTGSWEFYSASANASEVNGFAENAAGIVHLTPGRHDAWKTAVGTFSHDWSLRIMYGGSIEIDCAVNHSCHQISCPHYIYTRRT